ncbi:MAG: type II toxin-antitoxin system HicA family toxin [Bacteroidales bacterium]|nr:type II toxin-antitoxin system HicA family toxin [Bacteroidales bacterium]
MLKNLGFEMNNKGKTSGSRVKFKHDNSNLAIIIHKPHTQGAPIREEALRNIYNYLINENLIS